MAGDGDDCRVGNELVGDGRAAFSGATIIFSVQREREALELAGICDGELGGLGNILAESSIITGHGRAHADDDALSTRKDCAAGRISFAYCRGSSGSTAGSQNHAGCQYTERITYRRFMDFSSKGLY